MIGRLSARYFRKATEMTVMKTYSLIAAILKLEVLVFEAMVLLAFSSDARIKHLSS